jgi:BolA family transcriptional regulator, general stress-responsive regulator
MTSTHESLLHDRLLALSPTHLEIENESHLHAGHAGSKGGASHFRVHIQADCFEGKRTVTQHRMVYDLVTDLMPFPIHALALHTSIPSKGNL